MRLERERVRLGGDLERNAALSVRPVCHHDDNAAVGIAIQLRRRIGQLRIVHSAALVLPTPLFWAAPALDPHLDL